MENLARAKVNTEKVFISSRSQAIQMHWWQWQIYFCTEVGTSPALCYARHGTAQYPRAHEHEATAALKAISMSYPLTLAKRDCLMPISAIGDCMCASGRVLPWGGGPSVLRTGSIPSKPVLALQDRLASVSTCRTTHMKSHARQKVASHASTHWKNQCKRFPFSN